ncbi:hypothetical protein NLI96_g7069 [Meripilus lineatus]|uniref:Uncharacterized protein n=1 Tax=Meripilus lineatus TaxID=2056292 RepID=A0AAD5V017_9APHY|nr:hypothetical protein NLI96_g7069 [Physisporinus lineatus]
MQRPSDGIDLTMRTQGPRGVQAVLGAGYHEKSTGFKFQANRVVRVTILTILWIQVLSQRAGLGGGSSSWMGGRGQLAGAKPQLNSINS